ncbi:MAG TPA: hypothetical protein VF519_18685 [Mycobacteriales bacterium]
MARRAILAGAAFAVALAGSFALPPASALVGDTCGTALPMGATVTGVVGGQAQPQQWWLQAAVPGRYVVTLVSAVGDADLVVADGACGTLCSSSRGGLSVSDPKGVTDSCTVAVTTFALRVAAQSASSRIPANYSLTIAPLGPNTTECRDGLDNDADAFIDLSDSGCEGVDDLNEGSGNCHAVGPGSVCVDPGAELKRLTTVQPEGQDWRIAGYLDRYRFDAGEALCPVLVVKPLGTNDTCAFLGGTFVERVQTLLTPTREDDAPTGLPVPNEVVLCKATVSATAGQADESVDTYWVC